MVPLTLSPTTMWYSISKKQCNVKVACTFNVALEVTRNRYSGQGVGRLEGTTPSGVMSGFDSVSQYLLTLAGNELLWRISFGLFSDVVQERVIQGAGVGPGPLMICFICSIIPETQWMLFYGAAWAVAKPAAPYRNGVQQLKHFPGLRSRHW